MTTQTSSSVSTQDSAPAAGPARTLARGRLGATTAATTHGEAPATTRRGTTVAEQVTRSVHGALAGVATATKAQIRDRAYFIYIARNGAPGNAENDWLQAETELRAETETNRNPLR